MTQFYQASTMTAILAFTMTMPVVMPAPVLAQAQQCRTTNATEIASLFDRWNQSLQTGDPNKVVANYDADSILLATLANKPRITSAEKKEYFVHFLEKKPVGKIDSQKITIDCNTASNSGVYTFTFGDGSKVQARYTYNYRWNGKQWLIATHHSSAMPEKVATAAKPEVAGKEGTNSATHTCRPTNTREIASLFDRWNQSLQTGNPDAVVANYGTSSVLLPTLSNEVLMTAEQKKAYFTEFLKKKPSGIIDMRSIFIDCNSAVDAGLYTFTFGDGTQAKARYTYTYGWNGSKWVITSHHSSLFPQR
ncbi:MAG: nuclear transport factor 2 family protein [Pseudanabaena sp. ELA607]